MPQILLLSDHQVNMFSAKPDFVVAQRRRKMR
jgi:hypothetical protein